MLSNQTQYWEDHKWVWVNPVKFVAAVAFQQSTYHFLQLSNFPHTHKTGEINGKNAWQEIYKVHENTLKYQKRKEEKNATGFDVDESKNWQNK